MGKETKIGLSVIGVLMVIFSGVLYYRLTTGDEPLADATELQSKEKGAEAPDAAEKPAVKSKLIPGDVDTPLRSQQRNWAQASPEAADDSHELAHRPHARQLVTAGEEAQTASDEQASTENEQVEPAGGNDPFAARSLAVRTSPESASEAETATATDVSSEDVDEAPDAVASVVQSADEELQSLPERASTQNENPLREQAGGEVAEEGDPAPTRSPNSRLNQPTLATGTAAQTRVSQASDQQPASARQPLRSRTAQPTAAAEDRYSRSRDEVAAEPEDVPRRGGGDFAARGNRDLQRDLQSDSQPDLDTDRPTPESRPGRLGGDGARRPKPARVAVPNGKYKVQPNDNYWTISEKVYGSGNYFKAIHEHNRLQHPESDSLSVGEVIEVLSEAELLKRYPALCPKPRAAAPAKSMAVQTSAQQRVGGRVYVVEQGDTLFDIARHELGKASRWAEIYDLNRDALGEDFDFLQPGTELMLPTSKRETEVMTRQNDEGYRR